MYIIVVSFMMYADTSTEYKSCADQDSQSYLGGMLLYSTRSETPLGDCWNENMTKFLFPIPYFARGGTPLGECLKEKFLFRLSSCTLLGIKHQGGSLGDCLDFARGETPMMVT